MTLPSAFSTQSDIPSFWFCVEKLQVRAGATKTRHSHNMEINVAMLGTVHGE